MNLKNMKMKSKRKGVGEASALIYVLLLSTLVIIGLSVFYSNVGSNYQNASQAPNLMQLGITTEINSTQLTQSLQNSTQSTGILSGVINAAGLVVNGAIQTISLIFNTPFIFLNMFGVLTQSTNFPIPWWLVQGIVDIIGFLLVYEVISAIMHWWW